MSLSDDWRDYVLEQLSGLGGVSARNMFGGAGLYAGGVIFAVMDNDQVFFKVDDETRPAYQKLGAKPWEPMPGREKPSQGYYELPGEIIDDRDELVAWARLAVEVAHRKGKQRASARDRMTKPSQKRPGLTPTGILKPFSPGVRRLSNALRALVKRAAPRLKEVAYPGWKAVGYRHPDAGYVCGVFPQKNCVRLIFEHGAGLDDPAGLLEGGGKVKQVRYITIRTAKDIKPRTLTTLIRQAISSAP